MRSVSRGSKTTVRRVMLGVIVLLYAFSVPWYRSSDSPIEVWWGLPDWVAVALGAYVLASALAAVSWLLTEVPDREDEG